MKTILFFLCIITFLPFARPQTGISTMINNDPSYLTEEVFIAGGCFDVSNATISGGFGSVGTFTNGASSVGIDNGIILSTGSVLNAHGPNSSTNFTTNFNNLNADPDLAQIINNPLIPIQDVAILEFDFIPTANQVSFQYVFASEEYCDFVNTLYNDVFGFFISGPGINGTFSNNAENIAKVPGTNDFVAINNINHLTNTNFYVDNIPANDSQVSACPGGYPNSDGIAVQDCEFDGFTTLLTSTANVIPCQVYHIKLVIGDVTDGQFDSAVFLKANSFDAGETVTVEAIVPSTNSNTAYEGCPDAYFLFQRFGSDLGVPLLVNFSITTASTAISGLDYMALPNSITFAAGQDQFQLPVTIFSDGITEGIENIVLEMQSSCSCSSTFVELQIQDTSPLTIDFPPINACSNNLFALSPEISGGLPPYIYLWDNGATSPTIEINPEVNSNYALTVTDACGNMMVAEVLAGIQNPPEAELVGSAFFCNGEVTGSLEVHFTNYSEWTFIYSINGIAQTPVLTIENPFVLPILQEGTYALESVNSNGCEGIVSGSATIYYNQINLEASLIHPQCAGDSNGAISLVPSGGEAPYTFSWGNGLGNSSNLNNLSEGIYWVTITDSNNCETTETFELIAPTSLQSNVQSSPISCHEANDGSITIMASGGTPPYQYAINNENFQNAPTFTDLLAGNYFISIIDAYNCQKTISISIEEPEPLEFSTEIQEISCADVQDGSIEILAQGGTGSITYSLDGINFQSIPLFSNLSAGTHNFIIKDENECSVEVLLELSAPEPIEAFLEITPNYCAGEANGQVQVIAIGGTGELEYSINNQSFQTSPLFTNLPSGSFSIKIKDQNDCLLSLIESIYEPEPIFLSANLENAHCFNSNTGSISLNASGGTGNYWYSLNGGGFQNANSFNHLFAGTYDVSVQDDNNCVTNLSLEINEPYPIEAEIETFSENCSDAANTYIIVSASGGSGNYGYSLDGINFEESNQFNGLTNGDYSIFIRDDNYCLANFPVNINFSSEIILEVELVPNGCDISTGGQATIIASGGGGNFLYSLDNINFQGDSIFSNLTGGDFTAYVVDGNHCEASISFALPNASPIEVHEVIISTISCFGASDAAITILASGGQGELSYLWNNEIGAYYVENLPPGTHYLAISDEIGCVYVDTFIFEEPPAIIPEIIGGTQYCQGESGILTTAAEFHSYYWSTQETQQSIEISESGTYEITVTDQNGCFGMADVEIQFHPLPEIEISGSLTYCPGGFTTLNAENEMVDYLWSTGDTISSIQVAQQSAYSLTIIDANGCIDTDTVFVEESTTLNPIITGPLFLCSDDSVLLATSPNYLNYEWSNQSNNSEIWISEPGEYSVTVQDQFGCSGSTSVEIQALESVTLQTNVNLCWGDSLFVENQWQTISGLYVDTFLTVFGCDSIRQVMLNFTSCEYSWALAGQDASCAGEADGALQISLQGGLLPYTIHWQNNLTNLSNALTLINDTILIIEELPAGNYEITINDGAPDNLPIVTNVIINESDPLEISLNEFEPIDCFENDNGRILVHVEGGRSPYHFSWNTGESGNELEHLTAGTYQVTITDSLNCQITQDFILASPLPLKAQTLLKAPVCNPHPGAVLIHQIEGGTPPYLFAQKGFPFQDSPLFYFQEPGSYTLILQDANGCEIEFSPLEVPEMEMDLHLETTKITFGDSLFLNKHGGQFHSKQNYLDAL